MRVKVQHKRLDNGPFFCGPLCLQKIFLTNKLQIIIYIFCDLKIPISMGFLENYAIQLESGAYRASQSGLSL